MHACILDQLESRCIQMMERLNITGDEDPDDIETKHITIEYCNILGDGEHGEEVGVSTDHMAEMQQILVQVSSMCSSLQIYRCYIYHLLHLCYTSHRS